MNRLRARDIVIVAMLSALLLASQVVFAALPNIELVSLLVIVFSVTLGWRSFFIVGVFVLLEGLVYGFGTWWFCYLYIWPLLVIIAYLFRKLKSPLIWACISGGFGLMFGALCSVTYLFIGGAAYAFSYWMNGIPFDIIHCVGNFAVCLALFKPLTALLGKLIKETGGKKSE